jgi:type I restriction enzyme S subunit
MYGEGKTRGQVSELTFPATINQACAAIQLKSGVDKEYVKLILQSNYETMRGMASGGTQPNLNLSKIRSIQIPLPSLPEQTEIAARSEILLPRAFDLYRKLSAAWQRQDDIISVILTYAFRGKLVDQKSSDEPAMPLLERIKANKRVSKT